MGFIKKIEEKLLKELGIHSFDISLFSDISAKVLEETDFPPAIELLKDSLTQLPYHDQNHLRGVFADIPFTLVKNDHFSIDLFFWFHAHTSIHDHPFIGAFKVLEGSSRHLEYRFNHRIHLEPWLFKGDLELIRDEKMAKNHVQKVILGKNYIHQVLHKECPTVTLIVKSSQKTEFCDYIYPSYAWVDRKPQEVYFKRLSLISSIFKTSFQTDSKFCQAELEMAFGEIPAHDLFLMSYNYAPAMRDENFQIAFEKLILSDIQRFSWYNELKSCRNIHTDYIQKLIS